MADEELPKIVVELRKFRKKLRQIEKLEELERDLTDEEFFKLSKKDEIRSTVQKLVAREEELKSKLQNMERNEDEQVLAEQEEQASREDTQDQVQSTSVGPQEGGNENAQNGTGLTINEIYDQAPVVEPSSAAAIPDIVPTATTRTAPILSSTQTYMRFQVRNLQGHNDLICGVDCRGSVLVSGRGNYLLQGCVKRVNIAKRICKRKHMIEQSQDQCLGENDSRTEAKKKRTVQRTGSSMVARSQRTDKEMVANPLPQSHGEFGKREVAVIPQNLLVDQNYKRHCSDSSIKAKNPRLDKSICSGEYLQPLAKSRRHKGFAITEVDDVTKDTCEPLASKEPSHVCIDIEKKLKNPTPSSRTFGEDQLSLQNKETLQSGNEQKQSAAIKGSVPVRRNIVIQTQEMYSVFSGEENLESYESVPSEHQQVEIQAKRQTPGVNGSDVGEVVVDKGEEVASESGNVVTHQSVELQANKQTPGVKENDGEEIAVVQNQAVASESGNVLTQQPVELEANKQTPIVNENDVGEIPVDKKQAVTSESFNLVVLSEQQQVEIKESSKQTPCVNENAVGEIAVDQNQAVTSESLNVVASEHQQVEIKESSNQMPGVNESDVGESAVDPKEAISTESINVLTSAGQQVEIEASNQKTGNGSDDGEIIIDQRTSVASESSNVVTSERPQLEIEASYLSSGVNESGGGGGGVDQREAVASAENENDVGETVVDPGEAALTESITAGTSDGQQFEIEGCNQTTGVNGSDIGESSVDQGEAVASGSVNAVSSQHQQLEIEVDSIDHSTVIDPSFSKRKSESKDAILDKQKSDAQWKCVNQIQVQEPQLPSTKSGELHPALESEVLVFSQHQHLQPGTNKQAGVITDSVTVRGSIEDPNQDSDPTLSSAKSDSVLKLENQKTFLSDHEQLEVDPYNKRTMVAENFKEMFEDQSHDSYQGASSSKSGLVHLISENENLPLSDSLQLKTVTSKQTAAKTESGVEGMDVDQISHDLDEARQPLTKDSHAHYEIESNGSLESEQQLVQTEFESQVASINNTSDVAVSKNEFRSSAVSQFRLALFSGKRCDNRVGVGAATKNIVREVVAIESHDPDQTLSTAHSSEFHPSYDNKDTLSSEEQHQASKRSPDKPAMTKSCGAFMDVSGGQDQYQTVISNTSYKNESKGSILTSNQALQENESNTTITGNVDHNIVADSDLLVSVSCEAVGKRHQETQTGRSLEEVAVALPVDDDMLLMDRSKIQRLYSSKSGQVDLLQDNLRVTPLCEWEEHNSKQNVRMTVNDDDRKVAGQWESSLEQIALNKSSSGSQQVQIETSTQMAAMTESGRFSDQTAGVTENDRDRMVVGQKKSPLESASGFGEALFLPETETSLSKGSQLVQLETNNQMASMTGRETFSDQTDGMTENDSDRMVVGQKESPLKSASGVGEASFLPETKTTFSCRFQLETSIQMAGTTGSVEEMDGDEREVNSVSPREGDQTHSTFENKTVFGNKHQQLYSMKSIRVSATAKNVNDQCQNQDPRVALTSNNHICSTAESITRRKRQDEETKNSLSKGDITETSEERMLVDKSELQLGSPSSSGQVHLASEMNQAAPSRYGQSGHETLSQTGITENAEDGMVLGQRQDLGVSSRKEFGQGGRISESRTTLPNDIQEMEANTRNQIVTTAETTYSLKGADLSQGQLVGLGKESGQEHDTPTSRSPLHENRKIQAEKSTHTAVMTDIGNHAVQDSDTATCSNYAMTSGLTHLKTEMWKKLKFSTRVLKGHTGLVCGVDCCNSLLVSGGRDTMLKLWDADTGREMRSMGGHTGTITSVFLVPNMEMSASAVPSSFRTDQYSVLTGSKDCSMKIWSLANGQIKRSMYAFSPVECLDCNSDNLIAAGLDGGKVELWDMESGTAVRSIRGHDEDAVTAVKFQDNRVISGSATGVVKVWDIRDNSLKPVMSSDQAPTDNTAGNVTVKPRRVRCLATTQETVYWGDDGVNIKAMELTSGKIRKIRNHVTDFGSTGAMATSGSCLVSAGYDLDRGNGYLNVRSIPSEEYLATVDDECTGRITCLSCTQTTRDQVTVQRMCTGGLELKLWDQLPSSKVKKRSRPEMDDVYVTTKHLRRYSLPDISDTESSEDDEDQPEGEDSDDDDDVSSTGNASRSWCTIS